MFQLQTPSRQGSVYFHPWPDLFSIIRDKKKKPVVENALNHLPPDDHPPTDTIMVPVLPSSTKTVTTPKAREQQRSVDDQVDQFVTRGGQIRHKTYLLNHSETPGEHALYKVGFRIHTYYQGEVEPSVSKKGFGVRFTGMETLTTNPTPTLSSLTGLKRKGIFTQPTACLRSCAGAPSDSTPASKK